MTRVLTALCVFFCAIFSLSGCSDGGGGERSLQTDFCAELTAQYRGTELSGRLTYTGEKSLTLELLSPESLGGLSLDYRGGVLSIGKNGLLCTADEAYLPPSSFPSLLKAALGAVAEAGEDGRLKLDGSDEVETPFGTCVVTADSGGIPERLEIREAELAVELSGRRAL